MPKPSGSMHMSRNGPFAPVRGTSRGPAKAGSGDWEILVPVPAGAKTAPSKHRDLGKPTSIWPYTDQEGKLLGYIARFDGPDGKQFRPLTLWRSLVGLHDVLALDKLARARPLYGLQRLAERPSAPVVVTEGEKAADAAARLLPAFAAVTSPNGSKCCRQGRLVAVARPRGDGMARRRCGRPRLRKGGGASRHGSRRRFHQHHSASARRVRRLGRSGCRAAGWDEKRAAELVASAVPANGGVAPRPRRRRQRDDVIGAVLNTEGVELWRDPSGTTYASVPVNGHTENWSLRSHGIERWLSGLYYRKTGVALPSQALEDIRRTLDIKAYEDGRPIRAFRPGRRIQRPHLS